MVNEKIEELKSRFKQNNINYKKMIIDDSFGFLLSNGDNITVKEIQNDVIVTISDENCI